MAAARESARLARQTETLAGVGIALVLVVGASRVRAGIISPGELLIAVSYTRMIYKPIRKLSAEGAKLAKATACGMRVMELLDEATEVPNDGIVVGRLDADIRFDGVSHRYHDGRDPVEDTTLDFAAGEVTAIVGENGAGKSTLLTLLLRLQRPTAGRITIGGIDIASMELASYRSQIAYVPQELALFGGTIRENIAFAARDATDDEILRAAADALLLPVLERLPNGLDTVLDEDGASLSGGQARRLMLARAALRDASILLLDEPLTGLDPEARDTVAQAISRIADGRTTLVVHHGDLCHLQPDAVVELRPVIRQLTSP